MMPRLRGKKESFMNNVPYERYSCNGHSIIDEGHWHARANEDKSSAPDELQNAQIFFSFMNTSFVGFLQVYSDKSATVPNVIATF